MNELALIGHAADCKCAQHDVLEAYERQSNILVAKALAISEVAQIAKIEVGARRALLARWDARAEQAARSAGAVYKSGGTLAAAYAAADKAMRKWESDVGTSYVRSIEDVYKLARKAGWKKATGVYTGSLAYMLGEDVSKASKPKSPKQTGKLTMSLDAKDERALDKLSKQEMWWIGDVYENMAPTIRDAVQPKVLEGLNRKAGGEMVQAGVESKLRDWRIPDGYNGSAKGYFEGLAANSVTAARVNGQLGSFIRLGVTTYTLVNPMDARTSEICAELNGTEFKVADAEAQLDKLAAAKNPDAFKAIKPWLGAGKIASLALRGPGALSSAGQLFPPFHYLCRTTVDVAAESLSFSALED
jgi:hypothetical protein